MSYNSSTRYKTYISTSAIDETSLFYLTDYLKKELTPSEPQSRCWGQTTPILSSLSPKRDCGSRRVKNEGLTAGFRTFHSTFRRFSRAKEHRHQCRRSHEITPQDNQGKRHATKLFSSRRRPAETHPTPGIFLLLK